ncbi:unnamed protein product [Heterobilharzia americana]|nr:unnamed protein product [Heterobilharzia americana]
MYAVVSASVFSASSRISSAPSALPDFSNFMAFRTSAFVGGFVFTCSSVAVLLVIFLDELQVVVNSRVFLKWSANRFLCFSFLVTSFPSPSFIGFVCVDLFPSR